MARTSSGPVVGTRSPVHTAALGVGIVFLLTQLPHRGGGVVYLVQWIYGMVVDLDSGANFVSLSVADNWLSGASG